MNKTLGQIYISNPITINASTDLMYFAATPYTAGFDRAMLFSDFAAQFVLSNAIVNGAHGGTGVNNGARTITIGGNFAMSGAFTFTGTLTNTTAVTFPTSGTLATTSQLPTPAALTKTDDTNVTLTLGGTPATALLQAASLTLGWTGQLSFARGGTNASLTASNGGIFYSTASAAAILAGTATAGLALLSGASGAPSWSGSPPFTEIAIQRITAAGAGTYTPTSGMTYVMILAQGAGGGGGGAANPAATQFAFGAGGGGGEYIEALFNSSQIGASKPYVVGAKGAGGAAGNNNGVAGANTTFNTTWIIATGGGLGIGGASGVANTFFYGEANTDNGGVGGSVATGTLIKQVVGNCGGTAFALTTQGQSSSGGRSGAGTQGGFSGAASSAAGFNGSLGAGGSGGGSYNGGGAFAGGDGGDGFITFIEFLSV